MSSEEATIRSQVDDLRAEGDELYALLENVDDAVFATPTGFKGWTVDDVIGHLHVSDYMGVTSLDGREAFASLLEELRAEGRSMAAFTARRTGGATGRALLGRWRTLFEDMCTRFAASPPDTRLAWFGPDMGLRMFITARQMETWAHGQEIWDLLGRTRVPTDRLRSIAAIGARTYGWTFANRRLEPPGPPPHVRLTAPSGALWTFHDPAADDCIEGPAEAFCQVVTQVRNVADTDLVVRGDAARRWMEIAQCFAGPPADPPPPGTRGPGRSAAIA